MEGFASFLLWGSRALPKHPHISWDSYALATGRCPAGEFLPENPLDWAGPVEKIRVVVRAYFNFADKDRLLAGIIATETLVSLLTETIYT